MRPVNSRGFGPVLIDPYYRPQTRARTPGTAIFSVIAACVLGPIGAILGIVLGAAARSRIEKEPQKWEGAGWANAGIALGIVGVLGWSAAAVILVPRFLVPENRVSAAPEIQPPVVAPAAPSIASADVDDPPAPTFQPGGASKDGWASPDQTKKARVGQVSVVDLGRKIQSLTDELARQRAEAQELGERVLVMTTASDCAPCRGVDRSIEDPLLQNALANVRVVRVDVHVFDEDLSELGIPTDAIPGFFLLAPDLTPRDGVDGGEWDDDIAKNIAPVLGPFVQGKYAHRRTPWKPRRTKGMTL